MSAICIQPADESKRGLTLQKQLSNFDQFVLVVYWHEDRPNPAGGVGRARGCITGVSFSSRHPPSGVLSQVHSRVASWMQIDATVARLQHPPPVLRQHSDMSTEGAAAASPWDDTRLFIQSSSTSMKHAAIAGREPLHPHAASVEVYPRSTVPSILRARESSDAADLESVCNEVRRELDHLVTCWQDVRPVGNSDAASLPSAELPAGPTRVVQSASFCGVCHLNVTDGAAAGSSTGPRPAQAAQHPHRSVTDLSAGSSSGGVHTGSGMIATVGSASTEARSRATREILRTSRTDLTGIAVVRISVSVVEVQEQSTGGAAAGGRRSHGASHSKRRLATSASFRGARSATTRHRLPGKRGLL